MFTATFNYFTGNNGQPEVSTKRQPLEPWERALFETLLAVSITLLTYASFGEWPPMPVHISELGSIYV